MKHLITTARVPGGGPARPQGRLALRPATAAQPGLGARISLVVGLTLALFSAGCSSQAQVVVGDSDEPATDELATGGSRELIPMPADTQPITPPPPPTAVVPSPTTAVDAPTPLPTVAPPPRPDSDSGASSDPGADPEPDPDGTDGHKPGDSTATGVPGTECGFIGLDSFGDVLVELTLASPEDEVTDLQIDFVLYDDGEMLTESVVVVEAVYPGEPMRLQRDARTALVSSSSTITCSITGIIAFDFSDTSAEPVEIAESACRVLGIDSFGDVQIEVELTNGPVSVSDLDLVHVLRADGLRIDSGWLRAPEVAPGEVMRMSADTYTALPDGVDEDDLECEVVRATEFDFPSERVPRPSGSTCAVLGVDSFGDVQVRLEVGESQSGSGDGLVIWALRDQTGLRIADGDWYIAEDFGAAISLEADTLTEVPAGLDVADLTCEVLAVEPY